MWALFVITLLPQIDDAKVSRINEYKSEKQCLVEAKKLEKLFNNDEFIICESVDAEKPIRTDKKYFWMGLY